MARTRISTGNLRTLAVAHAVMGYDIFVISLLNLCIGWKDEDGAFIHMICLIVYTPMAVSIYLVHTGEDSGFTLSPVPKIFSGIVLIGVGLGILAVCYLNYEAVHVYPLCAQTLSAVYAIIAGLFLVLMGLIAYLNK